MDDPNDVKEEIHQLREDVVVLRERLAKLNAKLAYAAWKRTGMPNRRGRRRSDQSPPAEGRRASDRR